MNPTELAREAQRLAAEAQATAARALEAAQAQAQAHAPALAAAAEGGHGDIFLYLLAIFLLACFVGYYVVWNVTPALHSPLMGVTNAISSVIIVGALLAVGLSASGVAGTMGFLAVMLASVNIFGGFIVTQRMLAMFRKKGK